MNQEAKISKEKDDVLRMARDRMTIHKSESNPDRYKRICGIAYELKAQGYINLSETTGGISLWITPTGSVFLENGGNEDATNTIKNEKRKSFWNSVCVQVISKIILYFLGIITGYLYHKYCS